MIGELILDSQPISKRRPEEVHTTVFSELKELSFPLTKALFDAKSLVVPSTHRSWVEDIVPSSFPDERAHGG